MISNITDISGFGLALHLQNLLVRNKMFKGANIYLNKIPMLEGAKEAIKKMYRLAYPILIKIV